MLLTHRKTSLYVKEGVLILDDDDDNHILFILGNTVK